jgi:hypothetical protein
MDRKVIFALLVPALLAGCLRKKEPVLGQRFEDDFERTELGDAWRSTGGNYRIVDGVLEVEGARNHTLWLRRRLPPKVEVRFDAWSETEEGDIKCELFGDGHSTSTGEGAYTATGYVFVLGGWGNKLSIIARMDEHGDDRKTTRSLEVEPGRKYAWRIRSDGHEISWWIDGKIFLKYDDPDPLHGRGHEYFGFNNWEAPVSFDNLIIRAL